jgi:uncharacterized protein (TIGR00251 family)
VDDLTPLRMVEGGVRIAVKLTPRARRDAIDGVEREADGTASLRVAVTAPPEDGKANAALIALLGKAWRLPKGAFEIVGGAAHRRKILLVRGDPASLAAAIAPYLEPRSKT